MTGDAAMQPVSRICAHTFVLPAENVDTDQIIPARFLTTTRREGLGRHLFADWRRDAAGRRRDGFGLEEANGAAILVAGRNFGCGSSREHAAWALADYGFRAVISTEIADIFRANALRNRLLPVVLPEPDVGWLMAHPGVELCIDLEARLVELPDGWRSPFDIDAFARRCLLDGVDPLGWLLGRDGDIAAYEETRACRP
jgi:3-isopropylmalate/(R)-2-methylmalate dehydratase small subunit